MPPTDQPPTSKPTKAQRAVLKQMADGAALIYFPDFNLAAIGQQRMNVQTLVSMVKQRLVTYGGARFTSQGIPCGQRYLLAEAGCAVLAALEAEPR